MDTTTSRGHWVVSLLDAFVRLATSTLHEHAPLLVLTAAYVAAAHVVDRSGSLGVAQLAGPGSILDGLRIGLTVTLLCAGPFVIVYALARAAGWSIGRLTGRPRRIGSEWREYRRHLRPEQLAGLFVVFFLQVPLMNTFLGFKAAIPALHPFAWDASFMRLDIVLHGGVAPWELLQSLVPEPWGTRALDGLYTLWFVVKVCALVWFAWLQSSPLRTQFLLSYFATWIVLGTVLATLLSSAGPCYYGKVTGLDDPYAPLMRSLHEVDAAHPLQAVELQQLLWAGHTGQTEQYPVEGIAAMPSLHVALPFLFALAAWRLFRPVAVALLLYDALILVASVHLGWHYAVDGYVAILAVIPIWLACGWVARRIHAGRSAAAPG